MRIQGLLLSSVLLMLTPQTFAAGLSAAVRACNQGNTSVNIMSPTVAANIATAVVRSLVGTAIDTAVAYLDDEKVASFEVVLPINEVTELTIDDKNTKKCLYVSSEQITDQGFNGAQSYNSDISKIKAKFFMKMELVSAATANETGIKPFRPIIRVWKYDSFLGDSCPLFRNCSKRDVAMTMGFMLPAATLSGRTNISEPFGLAISNATAAQIQSAITVTADSGAALPWFNPSVASGPINIRFQLVETSQPNAFTRALAASIAAQKTTIQDTVENKLKGLSEQVAAEAAKVDVTAAANAFETYQSSYTTALTTYTAYAVADTTQKKTLAMQYEFQRKSTELAEVIGKAAFKVAKLEWPAGGLGQLPKLQ